MKSNKLLWNDSDPFTLENNDNNINLMLLDPSLTSSMIIGTCIINCCEPCIKGACNVPITLCKGGRIITKTCSNTCGNYKFTNLDPGIYTILACRQDLCPIQKTIVITETPDIYMIHLIMNPKESCK